MPGTPRGCGRLDWVRPVQSAGTVWPDATVPAVVSPSRHDTSWCSAIGTRRDEHPGSAVATAGASVVTRARMVALANMAPTVGARPGVGHAFVHHSSTGECGGSHPHVRVWSRLTSRALQRAR